MPFAKIFGTDDDQILVVIDEDEGEHGLRFTIDPKNDALSLCSTFLTMTEDNARKQFDQMTEETAQMAVKPIRSMVAGFPTLASEGDYNDD